MQTRFWFISFAFTKKGITLGNVVFPYVGEDPTLKDLKYVVLAYEWQFEDQPLYQDVTILSFQELTKDQLIALYPKSVAQGFFEKEPFKASDIPKKDTKKTTQNVPKKCVEKSVENVTKKPSKTLKKTIKQPALVTLEEYDTWFNSGKANPTVPDLRKTLISRKIPGVSSKTNKQTMVEILRGLLGIGNFDTV